MDFYAPLTRDEVDTEQLVASLESLNYTRHAPWVTAELKQLEEDARKAAKHSHALHSGPRYVSHQLEALQKMLRKEATYAHGRMAATQGWARHTEDWAWEARRAGWHNSQHNNTLHNDQLIMPLLQVGTHSIVVWCFE